MTGMATGFKFGGMKSGESEMLRYDGGYEYLLAKAGRLYTATYRGEAISSGTHRRQVVSAVIADMHERRRRDRMTAEPATEKQISYLRKLTQEFDKDIADRCVKAGASKYHVSRLISLEKYAWEMIFSPRQLSSSLFDDIDRDIEQLMAEIENNVKTQLGNDTRN